MEKISERGKENIVRETREAVKPVVRELVRKLTEDYKFNKDDIAPAIRKGLDFVKEDL